MFAQVVNFGIQDGKKSEFLSTFDNWKESRGKNLRGCKHILACIDNDKYNKGCVVVVFDDQAALDEFSVDQESLKIFEEVKKYATGEPTYYEADAMFHAI